MSASARRRGRKAETFIGVLIMVAGILVLCYPLFLQWRNQQAQTAAVRVYEQEIAATQPDTLAQQKQAAEDYNARLAQTQAAAGGVASLGSEDSEFDEAYRSVLSASGAMATISIPKIDVNLPIYHGTTDSVLTAGAGHLYGTSVPIGGESTHTVIAAHRGSPQALMFTRLDELEPGDIFTITVLGEQHNYQVDKIDVIAPEDNHLFGIIDGEDHVSLMTCTPYGVNTSRLIVRGTRISDTQAANLPAARLQPQFSFYPGGYIICIIALTALLTCSFIAGGHRAHRRPHGQHMAS